jgi:glycosyltransferase involved in cell wall biosynthesis
MVSVRHRPPDYPEIGLIAAVPDAWGGPYMPRHQLLSRLARHFHVVWIDRPAEWRSYWLSAHAFRSQPRPPESLPSGFHFYRPGRWLPAVFRPRWLQTSVRRARLKSARRKLEALGCSTICLYLWRPEFDDYPDLVAHDFSCYHVDDEYSFSKVDRPNDSREVDLIKRVDQVIVHSRALLQKKGGINPHLSCVPNGVDYKSFASARPEPADLASIPHPRIGYVGVIKRQLDIALMYSLAKKHPEWRFVFVGPLLSIGDKASDLANLRSLENVHFLGNKAVEELPAYVQHMDVCTMCYEVNDYTKYIYPLKLHEYLAAGVPVVSSRVEALREFSDVVSIASDESEWSRFLARALSPEQRTAAAVASRRAVAQQYDWDHLASLVADIFKGGVERVRGPSAK